MNLPPRVKTQYPTARNIIETEITPVPIETVFFLEDGKQDPYQPNRYYFDYPGNWATSNNGENIVGLRSIKLQRSNMKLGFTIEMVKYKVDDYLDNYEDSHDSTINKLIKQGQVIVVILHVLHWVKPDEFNFDNLFETVNETMIEYLNKGWANNGFVQNRAAALDRDISMEDYYGDHGYHITICSPRNTNAGDEYNVSFKLRFANPHFKELFNVSELEDLWKEKITFNNVWDLKPCNVFSSIAEQSAHQYIGTTDIEYHEIKYFK